MHEDHITGLKGCLQDTSNFEHVNPKVAKDDWNYGKIYMHKVTYHLCVLRFPELEKYMVPLSFD